MQFQYSNITVMFNDSFYFINAVPVSAAARMQDTMSLLKGTLGSTANMVYEGVKECSPKEWSLELNIGFKGKASPVPVILSGESNVAIKVTAKWVND